MSKRLITKKVAIGNIELGAGLPVLPQTMTTTDTMDTQATVDQTIRCVEAGADLVRITAPSKKEAENLKNIQSQLHQKGINTPLVADIHFTPNAADIAAQYVDKVRINPGNYVDKKRFENIEYSDEEYQSEIQRIRDKFIPFLEICKQHNTAIRIGTNHGSLSDRIMSRYGDTAHGMVESAMEFLRIAREQDFHNIVLSMKSSNPLVMVESYRELICKMQEEFGELYPLHLGVTEAGDGMDGRVKSALGIGGLMADGIGDTIRVSLTEEPEKEIPVCQALIQYYGHTGNQDLDIQNPTFLHLEREHTTELLNLGGDNPSQVVATSVRLDSHEDFQNLGYSYNATTDKWNSSDQAVDMIRIKEIPNLETMPQTLYWLVDNVREDLTAAQTPVVALAQRNDINNHITCALEAPLSDFIYVLENAPVELGNMQNSIFYIQRTMQQSPSELRLFKELLHNNQIFNPIIWAASSTAEGEEKIIDYTNLLGTPFIDGLGDAIAMPISNTEDCRLAFTILQATRTRISQTEYISCPSCGRTLFDLQETTQKIRQATSHLKGLKIAVMGCIVNGPGEMADADFGYVGAGPDKISLYKGHELQRKNIPTDKAVDELIELLKEHGAWQEPVQS